MPPNYYLKPETALSKAKELIKVGKKLNALELLYEMMKLKRGKVWHKNLQDLMMLFVDLCVELKKNMHFRKVIYQYKGIVVQEAPQSMELVLRHYLGSIKKLTEEAHQKSKDAVLDIEDLDAPGTPESLMLNAVTTEGLQDRSDRAILGPWLRFLWESYRLVLDLLRTMSKFERFYYEIAQEAYEFCIKYVRKNELKKLTDLLRMHSTRNQWQSNQQPPNPELNSMQLQIRMKQLDSAMDLEMYNDAFKAVEDIWNFFVIHKKSGKTLVMKEYYTRVSDLLFRSGSHLFHAAALLKLMNLAREHKKTLTVEEITAQAGHVLCAILAIPLPQERMNFDKLLSSGESNAAKLKNLATLLGLQSIPTRQTLIRDFMASRVMKFLPQELKKLFSVFETEFQPLKMYESAKPGFDYVEKNPELAPYLKNLHDVCIAKTLLQVSQVFRSIKFEELCALCPMVDSLKFEISLVELIHNLELPIRIDHRNAAVHFDIFTDMGISQRKFGPLGGIPGSQPAGYSTDQLTRQLNMFSEVLQTVNKMIPTTSESLRQQSLQTRQKLITDYQRTHKNARKKLEDRWGLIERYKKQHENDKEAQAKLEMKLEQERREKAQREQEEEELHLQEEARERERRRAEEEAAHLRRKMNRQHITNLMNREAEAGAATGNIQGTSLVTTTSSAMKKGTGVAAGVLGATVNELKNITDEKLDNFNANEVLEKKRLEMIRRNKDLKEKARLRAQNLDYLTRAIRRSELELLKIEAQKEIKEREEFQKNLVVERERKAVEDHKQMLENRDRLKQFIPYVKDLREKLQQKTKDYNEKQMEAWEKRCDEERAKRLEQKKKELEEQMRIDEERRKQAELEKAKEQAAAAARIAHTSSQEPKTQDVDNGYVLVSEPKNDDRSHAPAGQAAASDAPKLFVPRFRRTEQADITIQKRGEPFGRSAEPSTRSSDNPWVRNKKSSALSSNTGTGGFPRDDRPNNVTFTYGGKSETPSDDQGWKMSKKR